MKKPALKKKTTDSAYVLSVVIKLVSEWVAAGMSKGDIEKELKKLEPKTNKTKARSV